MGRDRKWRSREGFPEERWSVIGMQSRIHQCGPSCDISGDVIKDMESQRESVRERVGGRKAMSGL